MRPVYRNTERHTPRRSLFDVERGLPGRSGFQATTGPGAFRNRPQNQSRCGLEGHAPNRNGKHFAFTLLELLVSIGIIAILVTLVLPGLLHVRNAAKSIHCKVSLRQLGVGLHSFVTDRGVYPLDSGGDPEDPKNRFHDNEVSWLYVLQPHTGLNRTWTCPAGVRMIKDTKAPVPNAYRPVFYGYNGWGIGTANGLGGKEPPIPGGNGPRGALMTPVSESDVRVPSDTMAFADGFRGSVKRTMDIGYVLQRDAYVTSDDVIAGARKLHRGKVNAVFCDGHAESQRLDRVFFDRSDEALRRWNRDNEPHRERLPRQ
ncbi:MAG: type II secretion system protein [Verrucomicrobia bacterium]|nr:type II secretion system protein [Verrucomicrobiota bacterium]